MEHKEQKEILYPKDPKLKKALQALIRLVLRTGKAQHQAQTAIEAIMTGMEMIDDASTNQKQQSGSNYKKAKNYLKTLRINARLVPGKFGVVEIFIFTTDKMRVQTLDDLQRICSRDPEMQDMSTTSGRFDYSQPWLPQPRIIGTSSERPKVLEDIEKADAEIRRRQSKVRKAPRNRHAGIFKGSEDMDAARDAVETGKAVRTQAEQHV